MRILRFVSHDWPLALCMPLQVRAFVTVSLSEMDQNMDNFNLNTQFPKRSFTADEAALTLQVGWIAYGGAGHICVCVRKLGVKYMHACVRAFAHMGLLLCGVAMQEAGLSGAVALFVQDLDS